MTPLLLFLGASACVAFGYALGAMVRVGAEADRRDQTQRVGRELKTALVNLIVPPTSTDFPPGPSGVGPTGAFWGRSPLTDLADLQREMRRNLNQALYGDPEDVYAWHSTEDICR